MRLAKAFIPHLQKQSTQTALAFTTSQMALVPMMRCPNYGASKAALHHFILALRTQLQDGPGNVKVLEIYPPAVQTELHDAKHQPDLKDGTPAPTNLPGMREAPVILHSGGLFVSKMHSKFGPVSTIWWAIFSTT